ncbi:MAG TPA: hypothetical protein VMV94_00370 [Phycisphaerae bacterium]|nr:hypothetical protein [Phycisphaerae bacterium]
MKSLYYLPVAMLTGLMLLSQGCVGRVIGEGAEKTLGPKGAYFQEKPLAASKDMKVLGPYKKFELGTVKNDYGKNVPADFIPKFREEFAKQVKDAKLGEEGAGKTLLVNVNVIHYETADMADNVFGPLEQVVAHVELVDKDTGQVLASGNAIGRTGKSVGMGVDKKAIGLARGIVKWIGDYHPKGKEAEEKKQEKK